MKNRDEIFDIQLVEFMTWYQTHRLGASGDELDGFRVLIKHHLKRAYAAGLEEASSTAFDKLCNGTSEYDYGWDNCIEYLRDAIWEKIGELE